MTDVRADAIRVIADDGQARLVFACLTQPDKRRELGAAVLLGKPVTRMQSDAKRSLAEVRFDKEPATVIEMAVVDEGRSLAFIKPDARSLESLLSSHERMLVRVHLADGNSQILEFGIGGFAKAVGPVLIECSK